MPGWMVTGWNRVGGRSTNSLRDTDDTTLMVESEKELKSLLMRVKDESERAGLRLNIKKNNKKTKIMASGPVPLLHGE